MINKLPIEINSLLSLLESFIFFGGGLEREAWPMIEKDVNPFAGSAFSGAQSKAGDRVHSL
jgi:hypothetical protein